MSTQYEKISDHGCFSVHPREISRPIKFSVSLPIELIVLRTLQRFPFPSLIENFCYAKKWMRTFLFSCNKANVFKQITIS